MCLRIKNSVPKVAETDIKCYKILEECNLDGYPYMTPFLETPITNEIATGKLEFVGIGNKEITCKGEFNIVSKGFIHTYKSLISAYNMCKSFRNLNEARYYLFKCKIPAGTEYYEGFDDCNDAGYASDKITFVKKLNCFNS